jgi:hypothetical protein
MDRRSAGPLKNIEHKVTVSKKLILSTKLIVSLANEIEAAFRERRALFSPMSDHAGWSAALDNTLTHGRLEPAVHAAGHLRIAFPTSRYITNLCHLFEHMPAADEKYLPFHDQGNDVQIVRRENAGTVLFVFCGRVHQAGAPLCVLHRWFGRLPVSVVYLRDFRVLLYLAGISSLGQNRDETLASLRNIVSSLGGRRSVCYGNSGGSFPALHYGLDLGSEAVVCLSGVMNISPEFNSRLRSANLAARLNRQLPDVSVDLHRAYSVAKQTPRARIVYAEHNWDDRLHAEYMSGLPTVTLQAVPDTAHNVVGNLIGRGEYEGLLEWLVTS